MDKDSLVPFVPMVIRFFVNKVANPSDADDCAQKTLQRVLEKGEREEIQNLGGYALGVAKNVLREYWREIAKKDRVAGLDGVADGDVGELSIAQMGAGLSTMVNAGQWERLIADALRTLRLDYQTVLELYYWESLQYQEIAEIMDVPQTTLGTWLKRARVEIHKRLSEVAQQEGLEPIASKELERRLRGLRKEE